MIEQLVKQAEVDCEREYQYINKIVEANQRSVLEAFKNNRISEGHLSSTSGYGYDDMGRDGLEAVYAEVFGGEAALVRPQIVSGTHAISTALFGLLRPGDELVYITGKPYDTLEEVIGKRGNSAGSLKDYQIHYNEVDLNPDGSIDYLRIKEAISSKTKVIGIQRSKGYDDRPSFTIQEMEEMITFIKEISQDLIVFVDNCYGEFVEEKEPSHIGADIIAGSLIKNPGGGIVRAGGYIVGRKELVDYCANRLTAPGLGKETGATLNMLQEMYQGFFLAPHIVGEALKGAVFTARLLELVGFTTTPHYQAERTDLIQSVTFNDRDQMIAFCQAIQENSPVDSFVMPYPSEMPGYDDEVIMAAGTFIQGASIELTADGPIKPPYMAFVQGGLTYAHVKIALTESVKKLIDKGFLKRKQGIY
ncbi:methionine gamma-lyase family protein [Virgibacillus alimentarius]|uniref:methionine gamma-lyase family protein n=1 Tax=Virgibacillus alimentarius TaxID=698769 RepID=UPI000492ECBA|nr:methionine gamma-lyase family protein [Virgibacillus alimentarius]